MRNPKTGFTWAEPPIAGRGFTLVELLVVVAIIALLLAMLMPALQKARDAAKAIVCASNMHQVSAAIQMYASDWTSSFPPVRKTGAFYPPAEQSDWRLEIAQYLGGLPRGSDAFSSVRDQLLSKIDRYLECPTLWQTVQAACVYPPTSHSTFGMNWALGPNHSDIVYHKHSWLDRPAQIIMVSENGYTVPTSAGTEPVGSEMDQSSIQWNGTTASFQWNSPEPMGNVGIHEGQTNNILYCDGHVARWHDVHSLSFWPYYSWGAPESMWFPYGKSPTTP